MLSHFPDPAARLPGELDILAAVVAAPADDTPKLVYADWLDERDDPRGPYLRAFTSALRDDTELPDAADMPAGWLGMIGYPLLQRLRALGLSRYRRTVFAEARPAVAISVELCAENEVPVGATKFGGLPDLPTGVEWPQCAPPGTEWPRCNGGPLEFLAQLDLVDVRRTVAGRALQAAGLLSFFDHHHYDQGGWLGRQVIYTPPGVPLDRRQPPEGSEELIGRPGKPCRLTFAEVLDLPDGNGTAENQPGAEYMEAVFATPEESEGGFWSESLHGAAHQLFGYSHVTVLAEDPKPGPEWRQLLRFSSDRTLDWGWGDGHHLFWYIRADDLRELRFDRTQAMDG